MLQNSRFYTIKHMKLSPFMSLGTIYRRADYHIENNQNN